MPYAELTVTIPESIWIGQLSRSHPRTRFRVLAATADDEAGVARLEVVGDDPGAVVAAAREYDAVTDLEVFESGPTRRRVQVESSVATVLTALQRSGVPLEPPFEVRGGELSIETTVARERLSALGDALDDLGLRYELECVREAVEPEDDLLTDRQRRLLDAAVERGYYDTPRRITLTELADELDLAASTCSEVLHRAEERVVKEHLREVREPLVGEVPVGAD